MGVRELHQKAGDEASPGPGMLEEKIVKEVQANCFRLKNPEREDVQVSQKGHHGLCTKQ